MQLVNMQKLFVVSALSVLMGLSACASSTGTSSSSSASSSAGEVKSAEGSITGDGSISVANHRVVVNGSKVTVDGITFGAVPENGTVRYVVTPTGATLFVNGEPRDATAG